MFHTAKSWFKNNAPKSVVDFLKKVKSKITGIAVVPDGTDTLGYETFIKFIKKHSLLSVEGDFVEIGTFLGGGACKLAHFIAPAGKTLVVIDVFDPMFDISKTEDGRAVSDLYLKFLNGRTQYEVYEEVTASCKNIITLSGDSKHVSLPVKSLAFVFIDGNHTAEYVESDFYLVWNLVSSGGVVAFHDYESNLPETTKTIDGLTQKHEAEIKEIFQDNKKHILFVVKK